MQRKESDIIGHPFSLLMHVIGMIISYIVIFVYLTQVIEESLKVGADSNQFPEKWIFHSREKKPGKAFVDGMSISSSFFWMRGVLRVAYQH